MPQPTRGLDTDHHSLTRLFWFYSSLPFVVCVPGALRVRTGTSGPR
jgi:hypothetical protein